MSKSRSIFLWILSFVLMTGLAIYQRTTGPTYPVSGDVEFAGQEIDYSFPRTHGGDGDHKIEIEVPDNSISAKFNYRRFKSNDEWTTVPMEREGDMLVAYVPHQPPAGKVTYEVTLVDANGNQKNMTEEHVIMRFKGHVPDYWLVPHIFFMFLAMVFSTRTGFEALFNGNKSYKLAILTLIFLGIGGLMLGPVIQKYAFGAYWTGWPFGHDLTDNKTIAAVAGWVVAILMLRKNPKTRAWVVAASVIMIAVYLIPHSVLGSEIDYTKLDNQEQIQQ